MNKEICFVTGHCCIRVLKEAQCLKDLGYKIHLIVGGDIFGTLTANPEKFMTLFKSIMRYVTTEQMEHSIKLISKEVSIFHVHNEPSWPVTKIRELVPDAKIILDMHDSNYWRYDGCDWPEEDNAVSNADAFIVPSESCKKELSTRTDKPITACPPAVPYSWYVHLKPESTDGLVSHGGHNNKVSWRNYTDIYRAIVKDKPIFAYSPQFTMDENKTELREITNYYAGLGVGLGNLRYFQLLDMLGNYTWNLVGNWNNNSKVWQFALPNKFYDAVAAGIPSVVFNVPEVESIINKYDIGITAKKPENLINKWSLHTEKRNNLMLCRKKLSMENFIQSITKLYKEIQR